MYFVGRSTNTPTQAHMRTHTRSENPSGEDPVCVTRLGVEDEKQQRQISLSQSSSSLADGRTRLVSSTTTTTMQEETRKSRPGSVSLPLSLLITLSPNQYMAVWEKREIGGIPILSAI